MSELGEQRLAKRREEQKNRRLEIWFKFKAGAKVKDLARDYGYRNSSGISNILTRVEKELNGISSFT